MELIPAKVWGADVSALRPTFAPQRLPHSRPLVRVKGTFPPLTCTPAPPRLFSRFQDSFDLEMQRRQTVKPTNLDKTSVCILLTLLNYCVGLFFFEINSPQTCFLAAGETAEEQRKKVQTANVAQPSTNVIVQPPKVSLCGGAGAG